MRKFYLTFAVVLVMILALSSVAFAGGGMPAAHGMSGAAFGGAVSALARTNPGALAAHVGGRVETESETETEMDIEEAGGMPAAHGVTGAQFGSAVSGLAQADPAALAAHVRGR